MNLLHTLVTLLAGATFGCTPNYNLPAPVQVADARAKNVLVVWNRNAPESKQIAEAYLKARQVPFKNLLSVSMTTNEDVPTVSYKADLVDPVRDKIKDDGLEIDFILLMRGVPIRLDNGMGYSVDASLMVDAHPSRKTNPMKPIDQNALSEAEVSRCLNPYFRKKEKFSSDDFNMYLVTRLDGYTVADAMALIERSVAAKPLPGPFLLDSSPGKDAPGYIESDKRLALARDLIKAKGLEPIYDASDAYIGSNKPIMGYASWGSNDGSFKQTTYNSLKFLPGAICETFVSTSGRSFRPQTGGQSMIADLIFQGVTGIKGYVSEPFTIALAWADILFDRYTDGYNLAESFYAASPLLKWKDIVIGDPLCSPYKK